MKRRSFLAALGLAPLAPIAADASIDGDRISARAVTATKSIGPKSINQQLIDGDIPIPPGALAESWTCPEYQAECERARASGKSEPETKLRMVRVEPSKDHCGTELQLVDADGRVVLRQWNRK